MCYALETAEERGEKRGEKAGMQKAFDMLLEIKEYIKKVGCTVDEALRAKNVPDEAQQSIRMLLI